MLCIIIGIVLWLVLTAFVFSISKREVVGALVVSGFLAVVIGACDYGIMHIWGGFMPEYSVGVREGYLTKISKKGFIWKTSEGELQMGTGDLAAVQHPFEFSVSDPEVAEMVEKCLGKRVLLHYRQWAIMPCSVGDSSYEITKVEGKFEAKK